MMIGSSHSSWGPLCFIVHMNTWRVVIIVIIVIVVIVVIVVFVVTIIIVVI